MTEQTKRTSLASRRRETEEGAQALGAAKLALRVAELLGVAHENSGVTSQTLAKRMQVSKGRFSQILNGDGNLHVATIARFLRACGYELELTARPIRAGLPEIGLPRKRSRGAKAESQTWQIWEQMFVTPSGVLNHHEIVKVPKPSETLLPVGGPSCLMEIHESGSNAFRALVFKDSGSNDVGLWGVMTEQAVAVELDRQPEGV